MAKYVSETFEQNIQNSTTFNDLNLENNAYAKSVYRDSGETPSNTIEDASNVFERVDELNNQKKILDSMVTDLMNANLDTMVESFKDFSPLEIFARLNQLSYLMIKLNARMTGLEDKMDILISRMEYKNNDVVVRENINAPSDVIDLNTAKSFLNALSNNEIDSAGFIDKSIKLEEVFPDRPDAAYRAAYQAIPDINVPKEKDISATIPSSGIVF